MSSEEQDKMDLDPSNEQNQLTDEQRAVLNSLNFSVPATQPAQTEVRKQFKEWKSNNSDVNLSLDSVRDQQEQQLFFTLVLPSVDPIFFQVYCDEHWKPLLVVSENIMIEDQLPIINEQMESVDSLATLLELFSQTLRDLAVHFAPSEPPKPATPIINPEPVISSPIVSEPTTAPFPIMPGHHVTFPGHGGHMNHQPFPRPFGWPFNNHPAMSNDPPVTPTPEDWKNLIIPAVQITLTQHNMQTYEIEEWVRRIQAFLNKGQQKKALKMIQGEILQGMIPPHIQKFFDYRPMHLRRSTDNRDDMAIVDGTDEAQQFLQIELDTLKEINTKELGFEAGPVNNNLFHWQARLFGFGQDTKMGSELYEMAIRQAQDNRSMSNKVEGEVILEIKFPPNYPYQKPSFRIVKPRFDGLQIDLAPVVSKVSNGDKMESDEKRQKTSHEPWNQDVSLLEMIQMIRTYILDSQTSSVLTDNGLDNYSLSTVGGFWRFYTAVTPSTVSLPTELESGGKIILPSDALEELTQNDLSDSSELRSSYGWNQNPSLRQSNSGAPMIFEISAERGHTSYCGVEEFTAEEGSVIVPEWVLKNLRAKEGDQVTLRRVKLPRGTFVKLQPHTAEFLEVNDTRAMFEWVLPKFMVLNQGDTIVVPYRDKKYTFNVMEVKPGNSVHIIDSDINVDFAPPISGEVPTRAEFSTSFTEKEDKEEKKGAAVGMGGNTYDTTDKQEGVDYKICDNCRKPINMSNYSMHSLTCARNNYLCPGCDEVIQKSKKEEHMQEVHAMVYCECGAHMQKRDLPLHRQNDCPKRTVTCNYCPLQMPYNERFEHEAKCGSQTVKCEGCSRYIMKKDLDVHEVECQFAREAGVYNRNETYTQPTYTAPPPPQPQEDNRMACPICRTSFEHLDDLQVHMITSHEETLVPEE
ncbi:hypothetical protein PROFUN_04600 [Planoprotostelium fungivorum]|uniref:TRAF-type domain-containing protein n=1 Tax=Planoprotostelium fungivorum TaxID=1890364 RepID=A0A2P6NUC5_9EUKA|nr:hypothetical protein PROFUN_04600 [Planoprotostelium fungivorum]